MINAVIIGDKELARKLAALRDLDSGALDKAMLTGAAILATESKGRAPVRTGHLRDSHDAIIPGTYTPGGEAHVVVNAHYAGYVELGTSKMAARPYLRPAIIASRSTVAAAVGAQVAGLIVGLSNG